MQMHQDTMLRLPLPLGGTGFVYERLSLIVMCEPRAFTHQEGGRIGRCWCVICAGTVYSARFARDTLCEGGVRAVEESTMDTHCDAQ
jgi:hypothetical protein